MSAIPIALDGVKGRQRKMWASGDYAAVAARIHPMAARPPWPRHSRRRRHRGMRRVGG